LNPVALLSARRARAGAGLARILLLVASLPLFALSVIANNLHGRYDWESGLIVAETRNFADLGIVKLGGIPVQNNPPLTAAPDYYTSWPPLAPIIYSFIARVAGDGVAILQASTAAVTVLAISLIGITVGQRHGFGPAALLVSGFLTMPWTLRYGLRISMLPFGLCFGAAASVCWILALRRQAENRPTRWIVVAGACLMFLATLSSWEPVFLLPGFVVAALLTGRLRRMWPVLLAYGAGAFAAIIGVFALYASQVPDFFARIAAQVLYRMGLSARGLRDEAFFDVHNLPLHETTPGLYTLIRMVVRFATNTANFGACGLVALPFALIIVWAARKTRRCEEWCHLVIPFTAAWLCWTVVFSQQAMVHEFEVAYGAVAAACAIGAVAAFLRDRLAGIAEFDARWVAGVFAILFLLAAIPVSADFVYQSRVMPESAELRLGRVIVGSTEPNGIVLTSSQSGVPMYSARRHLIRGVAEESLVLDHIEAFESLCRECFVYLALLPEETARFPILLRGRPPQTVREGWEIYLLARPGDRLVAWRSTP
jgi:hypothetical protein